MNPLGDDGDKNNKAPTTQATVAGIPTEASLPATIGFGLPGTLDFRCPEGEITKNTAADYCSIHSDEYVELVVLLDRIKKHDSVKKLQETTFSEHFPNVGPFIVSEIAGLCGALKDNVKSVLPFCVRPFVGRLFDTDESKTTLGDVLGKSAWSFATTVAATVLPLFFLTVYDMFSPQDFIFKSCFNIPSEEGAVTKFSQFTERCASGSLVMRMYEEDNYPSRPVPSLADPDAECVGAASGINSSTYVDSVLEQQYFIFALLMLVGMYLSQLESHEKLLTRVSLGLDGVFIPCSNVRLSNGSMFLTCNVAHFFARFDIPSSKVKTWADFIPLRIHAVQFTSRLVEGLCLWYLATLFLFPKQLQVWYVFETVAAELDFIESTDDEYSNQDVAVKYGWCHSLTEPVELTYVKRQSSGLSSALLQALLFLKMCYSMIEQQQRIYDWVDPEEYMDESKKDACPYFDLHNNRNRIFSEAMLYDWLASNFFYPIFLTILTDPSFKKVCDDLGEERLVIAKRALESIHKKCSERANSPDGGFSFITQPGTGL